MNFPCLHSCINLITTVTKSAGQNVKFVCKRSSVAVGRRSMHFLQFKINDYKQIGVKKDENTLINLNVIDAGLPTDLCKALTCEHDRLLQTAQRCLSERLGDAGIVNIEDVSLCAPITAPSKVLAVGMNYTDHCKELGLPIPDEPVVFNKFPGTICSSGTYIKIPHNVTQQLDWEGELVIVVGKEAYDVSVEDAEEHIFGYTIANDLSARDLQVKNKNGGQVLLAKSLDNFCPLGPYLVTKDEVDVTDLRITTKVNGKVKQDSNTSNMIFTPNHIVSYLSKYFTLCAGDLILTGTPPGVGAGMRPPQFITSGDTVSIEIGNIGQLLNKFL